MAIMGLCLFVGTFTGGRFSPFVFPSNQTPFEIDIIYVAPTLSPNLICSYWGGKGPFSICARNFRSILRAFCENVLFSANGNILHLQNSNKVARDHIMDHSIYRIYSNISCIIFRCWEYVIATILYFCCLFVDIFRCPVQNSPRNALRRPILSNSKSRLSVNFTMAFHQKWYRQFFPIDKSKQMTLWFVFGL